MSEDNILEFEIDFLNDIYDKSWRVSLFKNIDIIRIDGTREIETLFYFDRCTKDCYSLFFLEIPIGLQKIYSR